MGAVGEFNSQDVLVKWTALYKAKQSHELQHTNQKNRNTVGILMLILILFLSLEGRILRTEVGTHHSKTDSG